MCKVTKTTETSGVNLQYLPSIVTESKFTQAQLKQQLPLE